MGKVLVCGDLHTKHHILAKTKEKAAGYDQVVFTGDYVDDWNAVPDASYNILQALVAWKKLEPEKVVLLLGNHDLSEWLGGIYRCSGWNNRTSQMVRLFMQENSSMFQVAYAVDNILITHAGVTQGWWKDCKFPRLKNAQEYATWLNGSFSTTTPQINQDFAKLAAAGWARGGWNEPSPLWADKTELQNDAVQGIGQVVGHSPVRGITIDTITRKLPLVFCDTHSTYPDGKAIGNNNLLIINTEGSEKCANYQQFAPLRI